MEIITTAPRIGFSTNVYDNPADIVETTKTILQDFSDIELELEDEAKTFIFDASVQVYDETIAQLKNVLSATKGQISVHAPYLDRSTDLASTDAQIRAAAIDQV